MQEAVLTIPCSECKHETKVKVNLWTGDFTVINAFKPGFDNLKKVVDHYKRLKGFDQIPTWDGQYRARAMAAAKRLLYFFRSLPDPLDVVLEYLTETDARAKRENWLGWSIENAMTKADEWILSKMKGAR